MLNIEPLPKEIFKKAQELGVEEIILRFQGGNDEGYLNVAVQPWNAELADEVEVWAWEKYSYNGAGDGSDYGDDITYDIVNKRASVQEWYTARREGDVMEQDFADLRSETEDNS